MDKQDRVEHQIDIRLAGQYQKTRNTYHQRLRRDGRRQQELKKEPARAGHRIIMQENENRRAMFIKQVKAIFKDAGCPYKVSLAKRRFRRISIAGVYWMSPADYAKKKLPATAESSVPYPEGHPLAGIRLRLQQQGVHTEWSINIVPDSSVGEVTALIGDDRVLLRIEILDLHSDVRNMKEVALGINLEERKFYTESKGYTRILICWKDKKQQARWYQSEDLPQCRELVKEMEREAQKIDLDHAKRDARRKDWAMRDEHASSSDSEGEDEEEEAGDGGSGGSDA